MEIGKIKTPWWFWVIGALFLLWNIFGCAIYIMDKMMTDTALLEYYGENGQAALDARHAYPIWATAAYALAVWSGLVAAALYLLRKKLTLPLFIFSLMAAIICFIPSFTNTTVKAGGGDSYWVMPVVVMVLGLFEILWTRKMLTKGIIR